MADTEYREVLRDAGMDVLKHNSTTAEAGEILRTASDSDHVGGMLEGVINPLLKLFGRTPIAEANAGRDELYQAITHLYSFVPQGGRSGSFTLLHARSAPGQGRVTDRNPR
jgi:hypothetical protein